MVLGGVFERCHITGEKSLNICGYLLHFSVTRRFVVAIAGQLSLFESLGMNLNPLLLAGSITCCIATASPVPILNFSGEVNSGTDGTTLSDSAVIGWSGNGGSAQVIKGNTDYGNGAWRLSIEDSSEAWQMTPHVIAAGDAFSLRFDAAMFAGNLPGPGTGF